MNKGSSNHYTLLLQDEAETDGVCLEEEEEEVEDGLNGIEEEEDEEEEEEEEEDEPMEDSDEEEIFSSSKHRSLPHHECSNLNGQNHIGGHGNEYQLLNNNDADLKTVLDTPITIWTPTPMSPARRACFIASIMFGILVVATFLWVLPCDVQPCEGDLAMRDTEWAFRIERTVISETQLVQRLAGGHNVLLSYHPSINISSWDPENSSFVEEEHMQFENFESDCTSCGQGTSGNSLCGLLMLDGNLGRKNWRVPIRECAVGLQCDLLDVSGDGVHDCIVRGSDTMLFMIEVHYGTILWHVHQHKANKSPSHPSKLSSALPQPALQLHNAGPAVLLPDVNNDGYEDLLFPGRLTQEAHSHSQDSSSSETQAPEGDQAPPTNQLVLVCGQSGSILGSPFVLKQCHKITSMTVNEKGLSYSCLTIDDEEEAEVIPLTALLHQILGEVTSSQKSSPPPKVAETNSQHLPTMSSLQDLCQVVVSNNGVCPQCQSKVNLQTGDGEVLWEKDYEHSTIVSWAPLLSEGKCHGAILKVWEWRHTATTVKTIKPPAAMNRRTTRSSLISEEMESLETEPTYIEKGSEDEIPQKTIMEENSTSDSVERLEMPSEVLVKSSLRESQESITKAGILEEKENFAELQPPTTLESPRARRDFLHKPSEQYHERSLHRHHNKQNSASHEDYSQHPQHSDPTEGHHQQLNKLHDSTHDQESPYPSKKASTTAAVPSTFSTSMRAIHPTILTPPGYQLQQIHERLALLRSNGSVWHEETLTSLGLGIIRLCKSEGSCLPSIKSHSKSVAVSTGVKERVWQLVSSSTTFDSTAINGEQHHTSPWTLTSIVRKIIVAV